MKVWVVVYTGPEGHDRGPLQCAVFRTKRKAQGFIAGFGFNEDWEFDLSEQEIEE